MLQHIMKSLTVLHVCWLEQVASDLLKEKILESVLTAVQRFRDPFYDQTMRDSVDDVKYNTYTYT